MFKTFKVWHSIDNTWTGGGRPENRHCLDQLDEQINKYAKENKVKVDKVDYSMVTENINYGNQHAIERRTYLIAGVNFTNTSSKN